MIGRRHRIAASLLLAVALWLPSGGIAHAHTDLVRSLPSDQEQLDAAPTHVLLEFVDPVVLRGDDLVVVDGSGRPVPVEVLVSTTGEVVTGIVGTDAWPGRWTVRYRVRSSDGHDLTGSFSFAVGTGVGSGGSGAPVPAALAAVVVIGAVAYASIRGSRTPRPAATS